MRTPRFTWVSDGNPWRRLLMIWKFDSSESYVRFAIQSPRLRVEVEHRSTGHDEFADGQGTTRELLYHLATGALEPRIGFEPITDNPMSSAHQESADKKATVELPGMLRVATPSEATDG